MRPETARSILKYALGFALLLLVFWKMNIGSALEALSSASLPWVAAGVALAFASTALEGLRLRLLMSRFGMTLGEAIRILYFTLMLGVVLPGGVGGEAYKVYRMKRLSDRWSVGVSNLVVDRLLGVTALFLITSLVVLFAGIGGKVAARLGETFSGFGSSGTALLAAGGGALLLGVAAYFLRNHDGTVNFLRNCLENARSLPGGTLGALFVAAGANFLLRALTLYCFIHAVSEGVPYPHVILVSGITYLSDLLPISVGSIGVWEGVVSFALVFAGLSEGVALAAALLGRSSFLIQVLFAVVLWFGQPSAERGFPSRESEPGE